MARLGVAMGADPMTFAGLAGIGDLIATCTSPLSRNRTFGVNLGSGMTADEAVQAMRQTCEGVKSCRPILELAGRHRVDMPITEAVCDHSRQKSSAPERYHSHQSSYQQYWQQPNPALIKMPYRKDSYLQSRGEQRAPTKS